MKEVCIEVKNLNIYLEEDKVINEISFRVNNGEIFGLLGANGEGKTTILETMIGLHSRDGGKINILGLDPEKSPEKLVEKIGVQFQSPVLFDKLTVEEMVSLFADFYQNPFSIEESINLVGLSDRRSQYIETMSEEEKHRLAVALALISNGNIIFLDEPTSGLELQSRKNIWTLIKKIKRMGKTIFLITSNMNEAEKLCDKIFILDQGQKITEGIPEALIEEYFTEDTIEFEDPFFMEEEIGSLVSLEGVTAQKINENKNIILYTMEAVKTITDLLTFSEKVGKPIKNLKLRKPTLQDLYYKLTRKENCK